MDLKDDSIELRRANFSGDYFFWETPQGTSCLFQAKHLTLTVATLDSNHSEDSSSCLAFVLIGIPTRLGILVIHKLRLGGTSEVI